MKTLQNILAGSFIVVTLVVIAVFGSTQLPWFNHQAVVILSGSMEPSIPVGAVSIYAPSSEYKIGDVIAFNQVYGKEDSQTSFTIIHRITESTKFNTQTAFLTKGDANDSADQNPVLASDIRGKVIFTIPYLGYFVNFAKSSTGILLLIVFPILLLLYHEVTTFFHKRNLQKVQTEKIKNEPSAA